MAAKDDQPSEITVKEEPDCEENDDPPSENTVKKDPDCEENGQHYHKLKVIFNPGKDEFYTISCRKSRTVLDAIKSHQEWKNIECPDENIIIQLGKTDKEKIVATHFPCSCVDEKDFLIMNRNKEMVETVQCRNKEIYAKDKYSIFYIDREGGQNAKTKNLFTSNLVKDYKYLCVYGEKDMTVEKALQIDGRFIDQKDFYLTNSNDTRERIAKTDTLDILDKKKYKISLPRSKHKGHKSKANYETSLENPVNKSVSSSAKSSQAKHGVNSMKNILEKHVESRKTIYNVLCQQFQGLKELMLSRFPDKSYQTELNLKKEQFGKIQQSFSEVHRVRKVLELSKSVCKLTVKGCCVGTGFVLFDEFILTNAHLFKTYAEGKILHGDKKVTVEFNFEDSDSQIDTYSAKTEPIDIDTELDYAVLEIITDANKETQADNREVLPMLLTKFVPVPENGEACLVGHPSGGVKKMDPICIIEKEERLKAVNDHLRPYRDTLFTIQSITQIIQNQGIENIMSSEEVVTYNTFMYHGASGSPVFDATANIFGLHTAGFVYGFPKKESVIEFAIPLLAIFRKFVGNLRESGNDNLLERVEKAAKGNHHLEKILTDQEKILTDQEEPMIH